MSFRAIAIRCLRWLPALSLVDFALLSRWVTLLHVLASRLRYYEQRVAVFLNLVNAYPKVKLRSLKMSCTIRPEMRYELSSEPQPRVPFRTSVNLKRIRLVVLLRILCILGMSSVNLLLNALRMSVR